MPYLQLHPILGWLGSKEGLEAILSYSTSILALSVIALFLQVRVASSGLRSDRDRTAKEQLFYLHEYLTKKEFTDARYRLRRLTLRTTPYLSWTDTDKEVANLVCVSYDQAGILITKGVIADEPKRIFLESSWGKSICHQYELLSEYLDQTWTPDGELGREFFVHFHDLYVLAGEIHRMKCAVRKIVSGGQTGADRAALDFAISAGIEYGGWCPSGGKAEDFLAPPGLLTKYPNLTESPSSEPRERTALNVRDSDATLILKMGETGQTSPGTLYTAQVARRLNRPILEVDLSGQFAMDKIRPWLSRYASTRSLNVAGPRESDCPGLYHCATEFLKGALTVAKEPS